MTEAEPTLQRGRGAQPENHPSRWFFSFWAAHTDTPMSLFTIRIEVPTIDIRLHVLPSSGHRELKELLVGIAASVLNLKEIVMASEAEFQAGFDRVGIATTGIATLIRTLIDRPLGGMTAAEEDAVKAKLEQVATSLEAMAATPTDPVPVPVPEPEPNPVP